MIRFQQAPSFWQEAECENLIFARVSIRNRAGTNKTKQTKPKKKRKKREREDHPWFWFDESPPRNPSAEQRTLARDFSCSIVFQSRIRRYTYPFTIDVKSSPSASICPAISIIRNGVRRPRVCRSIWNENIRSFRGCVPDLPPVQQLSTSRYQFYASAAPALVQSAGRINSFPVIEIANWRPNFQKHVLLKPSFSLRVPL